MSSLILKISIFSSKDCKVFSHILNPFSYYVNSKVDYQKCMDHSPQSFWAYSPCGYDCIPITLRVKGSPAISS